MAPKRYLTNHKRFLLLLLILSLFALYMTSTLRSTPQQSLPQFNGHLSRNSPRNLRELPSWYKFLANEFMDRKMRIGLLGVEFQGERLLQSENMDILSGQSVRDPLSWEFNLLGQENVDIINVKFQRVSEKVEWGHLFPKWVDEDDVLGPHDCPTIPLPDFGNYKGLNVVVARVPCGHRNISDVYRLQVNLIVANLLVKCGLDNRDVYSSVYAVFIGECEPMFEIFRCNDLLWHQKDVRIYKPSLTKLKQKLVMPIGSCQLARPFAEQGKEIWRRYALVAAKRKIYKPRQAYVTVLHSSEANVCGAITLAQSIIQSNSTRDLVLLADSSISPRTLRGLQEAGWKIKPIIQPIGERDAYSKLRIWEQLVEYEKVMFVDSDVVVLKNMDLFFVYPEMSAAKNDGGHFFSSGVMIVEPSRCTFEALMEKIRYNSSGNEGLLNEMLVWWHRLPMKVNGHKVFTSTSRNQRRVPYGSDSAYQRRREVYNNMPRGLREFCASSPKMDAAGQDNKKVERRLKA